MAIVFPRVMPDTRMLTSNMRLVRTEAAAALASGATQTIQLAPPRWRCDYTTRPIRMSERVTWRAWLESLGGALRTFLGTDPLQIWPTAYPGGFTGMVRASGGAFDGTAEASAISETSLSVVGLPSAFNLAAGDLFGLVQSGRYGLFRVLEPVAASGGGATLSFSPPVMSGLFTSGATVNFARPCCEMILDPSTPPDTSAELSLKSVTFTGIQRIY